MLQYKIGLFWQLLFFQLNYCKASGSRSICLPSNIGMGVCWWPDLSNLLRLRVQGPVVGLGTPAGAGRGVSFPPYSRSLFFSLFLPLSRSLPLPLFLSLSLSPCKWVRQYVTPRRGMHRANGLTTWMHIKPTSWLKSEHLSDASLLDTNIQLCLCLGYIL